MGLFSQLKQLPVLGFVAAWDVSLTVCNFLFAVWPTGSLVAKEHGGKWPQYFPPAPSDSRCSCPALNAMANHGILPHDGRGISFRELGDKIRDTYNFSPTLCFYVPFHAAKMLNKTYFSDKFNLSELDLHSKESIEHDASLVRQDTFFQPNQGKVDIPLAERLLSSASGKDKQNNPLLILQDVSDNLATRRVESKVNNPQYSLGLSHKMFGSANAATLIRIFGGRIQDLQAMVLEERIPDGWESSERARFGLTLASFNATVLKITMGIDEDKAAANMSKSK